MRYRLVFVAAALATLWNAAGCAADQAGTPAPAGAGAGRMKPHPAALFRAKGEPVTPAPDGNIFCEAEEFAVGKPGWRAQPWGANYYAATFANTFLSRKAFLGAPEEGDETTATINVDVKEAGRYLVLARYEAAHRFETQFKVKVEQNGQAKLDRLYGALDNVKVWAFSEKLKKTHAWYWGAVENVVWEGHDAYAELQPGRATITLTAGEQPAPRARRNVDLVMLTRDEAQVKERIEKESYLPLDGMLTQVGDVFARVTNSGNAKATVTVGPMTQHSPYWVHTRSPAVWKAATIEVEAGQTSPWTDAGGGMDTLSDGQWPVAATAPCRVEFGVKDAAGEVQPVRSFEVSEKLDLIGLGDLRYARKIATRDEGVKELLDYLAKVPARGTPPKQTLFYAFSSIKELDPLYGLNGAHLPAGAPRKLVDWRGETPEQLQATIDKLSEAQRKEIAVISLGDEIGLPAPDAKAATEGFVTFLKANQVAPAQVDPAAGGDWAKITYSIDDATKTSKPGLYYWSRRYQQHFGIQSIKRLTDVLRKGLPQAHIGANFSPHGGASHAYLHDAFQWVTCFREDGMTLPWAEDYIWQLPVGTPQMNGINLDLFRAGNRGKPDRKILYYVMPHAPGNTPNMWRRLYHNALGHGMTIGHLFEFQPVWTAYTENHVTGEEMYATILRTLRELGAYEDIVQTGRVRPAQTALWFSETSDIWGDKHGSFPAAKRALYVAILNQGVPLDFVVEQDAADGTLGQYKVLYLTDQHVSRAASKKIAEWVNAGGRLFATAGAGMLDESNQPNKVMRELLGVEQTELVEPVEAQVGFIKQDMPFAKAIESVTLSVEAMMLTESTAAVDLPIAKVPVFGVVSRVAPAQGTKVEATFDGGAVKSPAVVRRKVGQGETMYCAFLPSLSFFKPAIPLKPVDRGSTDDAMAHFLPTKFDPAARGLIGLAVHGIERPVTCSAAQVEASVIESKAGTIVVLTNWTGRPIKGLKVTLGIPAPSAKAELAGGGKVARSSDGGKTVYTLDLDVADVLVLR